MGRRLRRGVRIVLGLMVAAVLAACARYGEGADPSARLEVIRDFIEAVNTRDADRYVANFADTVVLKLYDGTIRAVGRDAVRTNRTLHFERFPDIQAEVRHVVEVGDRVVLHDEVWLHGRGGASTQIVEVFTFEGEHVAVVDVIQETNLLGR